MPFRSLLIKSSVLVPLAVMVALGLTASAAAQSPPAPERGWLGVGVRDLAAPTAVGLPEGAAHVEVNDVYPGSGAAIAGLELGEIILAIDDVPVTTPKELIAQLETRTRGAVVKLTLWRQRARQDVTVTLGARPDINQITKDRLIDQPLPADLTFVDLETGEKVTLGSLRGKPVLLEYWATYCGPCKKIVPWLTELKRRHRADGLTILSVTAEEREDVDAFLDVRKDFDDSDIVLDPSFIMRDRLGLRSLPTIVYVDREGVARSVTIGAVPFEEMRQHVTALLARPAAKPRKADAPPAKARPIATTTP